MLKNVKYAVMAIIFIGIAKLLQTTFISADYSKGKKSASAKPAVTAPAKKETKKAKTENQAAFSSEQGKDSIKTEERASEPAENTQEEVANETSTVSASSSLTDLKNNYLSPIIAKLPPGHLREDVVVRYYRHEKDGDKVSVLQDLGYYIHEKEATETAGFGSNVLYYGDSVPIEDIRIVAMTLLSNGISLKSIQRSRYDWKSNSLEVGTDMELGETSDITEDYIMHFTK